MKCAILLALAVLAAPAAAASATSEARLFLRNHAGSPPKADELAELKTANPEAYALVKALLTKRSLGLLNNRHPTASFAGPSKEEQEQQQSADQGPEVFAKFASPGELHSPHRAALTASRTEVAVPYAEVSAAPAHRDFFNWKATSNTDDETMVNNVLGAVAELSGRKKSGLLSKKRATSESALSADEASFGVETEPVAPKPAAPQPAAPQENSYLKTVDFGLTSQETPKVAPAAPIAENSYLKGIDLSGDMPMAVGAAPAKKTSQVQSGSANALSSFSWNDDAPEAPKPQVKVAEHKGSEKENSLMSWLGVVDKAPAPKVAPAAPAKPSNPYMMDLS